MMCARIHDWLHQRLDGASALELDESLKEHLSACATCHARTSAAQRLEQGLLRLAPPAAPPGLSAQIVGRVLVERRRRVRRARWLTAAASLAAALLVMASGLALWSGIFTNAHPSPNQPVNVADGKAPPARERLPRPADTQSGGLASTNTPPGSSQNGNDPHDGAQGQSLRDRVEEAGLLVASLGRRTADEALAPSRLFLPVVAPGGLGNVSIADTFSSPSPSFPGTGVSVSSALTPVTGEARRAVDLFLREVPPLEGTADRPKPSR